MPGQLGETLEEVVQRFNESQDKYQVNPVFKGFYTEVLNAAIAAYRAGDPPHFIQTHEPTVLTMMTSGAIVPVEDLFAERGYDVDFSKFLPPVHSWYATPEGKAPVDAIQYVHGHHILEQRAIREGGPRSAKAGPDVG